jgi:2-keto-4-pentenoate hydratase/2-oxohepta-3-ene-1,7-dioic acid hydratase in catechol pathway
MPELISYLSSIFTLAPGDIILTGTPAGVGPIRSGDKVVAGIASVGTLSVTVR